MKTKVGLWIDDWLHDGWSHSYPADHRRGRVTDPSRSVAKTSITIWTLAREGEVFTEMTGSCHQFRQHRSHQLRRQYEKDIDFNAYRSVITDGLCSFAGGTARPQFRWSNDRTLSSANRGAGRRTILFLQ
jgi:hypothetical protein